MEQINNLSNSPHFERGVLGGGKHGTSPEVSPPPAYWDVDTKLLEARKKIWKTKSDVIVEPVPLDIQGSTTPESNFTKKEAADKHFSYLFVLVQSEREEDFKRKVEKHGDGGAESKAIDLASEVVENYLRRLDVSIEVSRLFSLATHITFEPGMLNDFAVGLEAIVAKYGELALSCIQDLILQEETSISVAMEALRYIGDFESDVWHDKRRLMLETCLLNSRFAWIRDSAGVGISYLDDTLSIPSLKLSIQNESNEELKKDLIEVLEQLEETLLES